MLPDPLHPAIVHFPVVLAVLLPFVLLATWVAMRRPGRGRLWLIPVLLAGALTASTWVATETGETDEERVERVVSERRIEAHAEQAETFLKVTGVFLVLVAAGLLRGRAGDVARGVAVAVSPVVVLLVVQTAHAGGQLVYRYNAASAYGIAGAAPTAGAFADPTAESTDD